MDNDDGHLTQSIDSEDADREASLRTYEINTYPADFTLELIVMKWNNKEIKLAEGQRKFVWNQAKASKLIESFLIGLPVPPIYLFQDPEDNRLLIVDGQQRLQSIAFFFSGLFGEKTATHNPNYFSLVGLDEKSPYVDATFQGLKEHDELAYNKLINSVLRSFVMKQILPEDDTSIFQVFERLNTGGMILQPQEIRNCIYNGSFNDLLKSLNKYPNWRRIVGRVEEDKRMRDIELILRFFAAFYDIDKYQKPLKKFLNDFMKDNQRASDETKEQFSVLFKNTADAVIRYLGANPFHLGRGLNAAVYDSAFTAFARRLEHVTRADIPNAEIEETKNRFATLKNDTNYRLWVTRATTDNDVVPKRIDKAEQILFG